MAIREFQPRRPCGGIRFTDPHKAFFRSNGQLPCGPFLHTNIWRCLILLSSVSSLPASCCYFLFNNFVDPDDSLLAGKAIIARKEGGDRKGIWKLTNPVIKTDNGTIMLTIPFLKRKDSPLRFSGSQSSAFYSLRPCEWLFIQ